MKDPSSFGSSVFHSFAITMNSTFSGTIGASALGRGSTDQVGGLSITT